MILISDLRYILIKLFVTKDLQEVLLNCVIKTKSLGL